AQMAAFVVGPAVPAGVPLSALVRNLFRQAVARLKMRRAGVVPWLGVKSRSTIDDIRKFKGL
ncbi:MAG TPA: hypothetical protein VE010_01475, partial [Thermoanaerobaculia bacterium]|nr:hypothetical protein [Thermoanaerobaculia bacterium]